MKISLALAILSLSSLALAQNSQQITGWVIDSSCAYTKNLDKPISASCAKQCARNGSPLVILSNDKTVYLPIDSATPAHGQNGNLTAYAGRQVKVTGKVFERGHSKAIAIDKIERAK